MIDGVAFVRCFQHLTPQRADRSGELQAAIARKKWVTAGRATMSTYYGFSLFSFANSYIVYTAVYAGIGVATYDPNKKDLLGGCAYLSFSRARIHFIDSQRDHSTLEDWLCS